jgi:hypothetical protein
MRRIKSIKRRDTYILNVLFLASALLFYQTHADTFFKEATERAFEKVLPKGSHVEISGIKGGMFRIQDTSHVRIARGEEAVDLEVKKKNSRFEINGKANHVNLTKWLPMNGMKLHDIDFIGRISASINGDIPDLTEARISLEDVIVNFVPFDEKMEILLNYDKAKNTLNVNEFKIGNALKGHGYVRLENPNYVFLKWTMKNLKLENYAFHDGENKVSGRMFGTFTVKGPAKKPSLVAHLDVQNGSWDDFTFDSFIADLEGEYPLIRISEARICKGEGYMTMNGEIDLAKSKDGKAFDKVTLEPGENFFVWDEWSVLKKRKSSSVKAEKSLDEEFDLTFKADKNGGEEKEGHFLGVEHKVKF